MQRELVEGWMYEVFDDIMVMEVVDVDHFACGIEEYTSAW